MKEIVFVCTANICRSPWAEYVCREALAKAGLTDIRVYSRGVAAVHGFGAPAESLKLASERQLDLSQHRSRLFDPDESRHASLILVMSHDHRQQVLDELGGGGPPVYLLNEYAPGPNNPGWVPDPYGAGPWAYRSAFQFIDVCVAGLIEGLARGRWAPPT